MTNEEATTRLEEIRRRDREAKQLAIGTHKRTIGFIKNVVPSATEPPKRTIGFISEPIPTTEPTSKGQLGFTATTR